MTTRKDDESSDAIVIRNGKTSELMRWVVALILAGLVSYWTAQARTQSDISRITATQEAQFNELLRRLNVMQEDIRELREEQRDHGVR